MLPAMVLCAGLGARLRPLTDMCAKSLVPVGDRPALAHVLARLRAAGATRIVVNAHHRADDVRRFAREQPFTLAVSEEEELLGTAGGVARATTMLGRGDAIVWNADAMAEVDLLALAKDHASLGADATLVVAARPPGQGSVGIDRRGLVVRLRRDRFGDEVRGGEFLGISVLGANLRAALPERGCLVADSWIPRLRSGGTLRTFDYGGPWHDIGTLASYAAANLAWLRAGGWSHWLGRAARVGGAVRLDETILGADSEAAGSGVLARCIVWPGARAVAPATDAVIAAEMVVPVPAPAP